MSKKNLAAQFLVLILTISISQTGEAVAEVSRSFLRRPDVRGDQLVFTSEADLWLASLSTGMSRRITTHPGMESNAHFSPDGRMLAFDAQYDGGTDVYVMPVDGGAPKRLTWDPSGARVAGWTPDGAHVLFLSRRSNPENRSRLWMVPVGGGLPTLVPIPRADLADMAADGNRLAYVPISAERMHWKQYQGGQADDIWITNLGQRTFRRLTTNIGIDTTPSWAGDALYFISERDGLANLYRLNPKDGSITAITRYSDAEARYPSSDGKTVIFQHGDGLALYDIANDTVRELEIHLNSDRIHARPKRVPASSFLNEVAIGPTGKRVIIEARGQLISIPVEEGAFRLLAPLSGSRSKYPSWSRDGKQAAFISDRTGEDQVWITPADGSVNPRQLTRDHEGPLSAIQWSPDGKYLVTADSETRILLVDTKTGATTLVDQSDRGRVNNSATFSPDGKWLAFHRENSLRNRTVYLYNIAQKRKIALTSPNLNAFTPCWDPDGKFLYFLADRQFDPSNTRLTRFFTFGETTKISFVTLAAETRSPFLPVNDEEGQAGPDDPAGSKEKAPSKSTRKVDSSYPEPTTVRINLEGLADRVDELPVPAESYRRIAVASGRLLMLVPTDSGSGRPDAARGSHELRAFNLKEPRKREVVTIAEGIDDFQVSGDRKKLLIRKGRDYLVVDASAAKIPTDAPKIDLTGVSLQVDPVEEWKQIFHESWRIARDFFYAPNMHGVDWEAVRPLYAARLENVADRSELNEILGDMIAELICSHAGVRGGDLPDSADRSPMGYLGADYQPDSGGKAYRIIKLFRGDGFDLENRSPLLAPGLNVREGDYILLVGTAGRTTSLTINSKPATEGARQILVKPLADERKARYYDWVASRREYVRKHGGPNLGYIHLPNMSNDGMIEFAKHYYTNLDKDGIIYDDRYNTGGYISSMLILQMARKPITWFKPRYGVCRVERWRRVLRLTITVPLPFRLKGVSLGQP